MIKTINRIVGAALAVLVLTTSIGVRLAAQRSGGGSAPSLAPPIVKRQLSNGLRVWIVEQHELPVVQMSLLVLAGTDADPRGRFGIASLTSAMLTEGAGSRSAVEIADRLDALVANLTGSSTVDSSSLQLYVPVLSLPDALPLMVDAAERPTFPQAALDALRQQRLTTLRNARGDPDSIGALAFARAIYGPSHRGAAALIGTAESLEAVTPDALRAFHEAAYRPDNCTLIAVGDFPPDPMLSLLETHFGKWQARGTNRIGGETPPPIQRSPRQVTIVDLPDAPQSRILVGGVGASNAMADFFPIQVLNTVLQGRLSSDRNPTLRDYTTGVRSGFDMRKAATPFAVTAAAQADKTAASVKAVIDELSAVARGIPADELAHAKDDIADKFPRTFQSTGRISSRLRALESLIVYGLPDDFYANYVRAIQAVDAAAVQRLAREYIDQDHLTIVIVGDRKTIEPSIRALNLGSINNVAVDDVFAPAK